MSWNHDPYQICHNFILHTLTSYHALHTCGLMFIFLWTLVLVYPTLKRKHYLSVKGKAVLITGCDTGFGHHLAKHLDSLGVTVFAGCLMDSSEGARWLKENCSDRMHILQMNVTDATQIKHCLHYVKTHLPDEELWGVVNNAGLNFLGDAELTTMEQYTRIMNVNLLGYIRVTKTFLPLMRKNKGRVVNVTSVKGRLPVLYSAAYAITKYGGESFSDILRLEMSKFGVSVSIVEPCSFGMATDCLNVERMKNDEHDMWEAMDEEQRKIYGRPYVEQHLKAAVTRGEASKHMTVTDVIDAMTDALFSSEPRRRYLIGGGKGWYDPIKVTAILRPFLPEVLSDWLIVRREKDFVPADSLNTS